MISDTYKNFIYLADTLPLRHKEFYQHFSNSINSAGIEYGILQGTADIWAVDYMPVQKIGNKFLKYIFNPDYLISKQYNHLLTNVDTVWENLNLNAGIIHCDLILDGGNLVYVKDKLIVSEKIFKENKDKLRVEIIKILEACFQAEVIIIPVSPGDWTGHADGEVHFIDTATVLINEPVGDGVYYKKLTGILLENNLKFINTPCKPKSHSKGVVGYYINYLQVGNNIFVPVFGIKDDENAILFFEEIFKGCAIIPVNSKSISECGGVLRCISWTVTI